MVNLEWYRSFIAVYQTGTVTAAAEQRFLTQPALSQHISALENALKTILFTRTARRMVPTETAQRLYPRVISAIERLESIEYTLYENNHRQWIKIGSSLTYFTENVLKNFTLDLFNLFRMQFDFGETKTLIDKLKNNKLDLVLATQKIDTPRLHYIFLQKETFCLVTPLQLNTEIFNSNNQDDIEQWLNQQSWISFAADLPIIRRYWQCVFNKRPDFEPSMIVPHLDSILQSVGQGLGISVLPDYLIKGSGKNYPVHIPWHPNVEVSNTLYLVCQQDRLREPLIDSTISTFTEMKKA